MFYIKLTESRDLIITAREPIYRGDNLNQKITFLIPTVVGEIDVPSSYVFLSYIRADGVPDIVTLERMDEKYNERYLQYRLPVTCKLSKFPGEVCTWLQIYTGSPSNPVVAKSGECVLMVQGSKNMDDCICDHQLTAIYQLHKNVEAGFGDLSDELAQKADSLTFDEETQQLWLSSNGHLIGEAVEMDQITGDGPIHFSDIEGTDDDVDGVIHF